MACDVLMEWEFLLLCVMPSTQLRHLLSGGSARAVQVSCLDLSSLLPNLNRVGQMIS